MGCEPLQVIVYCFVVKLVIYWTYIPCKIECYINTFIES